MTAIVHTAELFAKAQERAEHRYALLKKDLFQPRLLVRYVRALRVCGRLQAQLLKESKIKTETTHETIRTNQETSEQDAAD